MKKVSFLIAGCLFSLLSVNGQENHKETHVVIALPEYNVLYRNYENKLIFASQNGQLKDIKAIGATMTKEIIDGKMGYIVIPEAGNRMCLFITTVMDETGEMYVDTSYYSVKQFPKPQITSNIISKTGGSRIHVSLSPDSPLSGINYKVTAIEVLGEDGGFCEGDFIPPTMLVSKRIGEHVAVITMVKNLNNGEMLTVTGSLLVQ